MPNPKDEKKNPGQEANKAQDILLGGIRVPEEHVDFEPDPDEVDLLRHEDPKPEVKEDEAPKLHEIDLNVPQFTDEQVADAIQQDKEIELAQLKKEDLR